MADGLTIEADWEALESGPPEERACFAAIGIACGDLWLTVAQDAFVNRMRQKVHLSGYHLAEWFGCNWWRLRWEPQSSAAGWALAHRMSTIGGGYIWPNITVCSDGERIVLIARPTVPRANEPLRYVADATVIMRAAIFEGAVDRFVAQIREQLRDSGVATTNLDRIWDDVVAERHDPGLAASRRFEALLGCDPDEAAADVIAGLMQDSETLGVAGMREMAAEHRPGQDVLTAAVLGDLAQSAGFEALPRNAVRLQPGTALPPIGEVPAWQRGAEAARALRQQAGLGAAPIRSDLLAELAGVVPEILKGGTTARIFFALDRDAGHGRVVLRSKWPTGRRFELARLLGDRIAAGTQDRLLPGTRAYTYRQKMQRSFAAEFLAPFEAVEDMLGDDLSTENQLDVADHFAVSELTIRTLLVNHRRLDRDSLDGDPDVTAAA